MGKRGPACTICENTRRAEIEALSEEQSARVVASTFGVSAKAVESHKRLHDKLEPGSDGQVAGRAPLGGSRPDAPPRPSPEPLPSGATLEQQTRAHCRFVRECIVWETKHGDHKAVPALAGQLLSNLKYLGRLTGALEITAALIVRHPEFQKVMGVVFGVLERRDLETSGRLRKVMTQLEAGEMPQR